MSKTIPLNSFDPKLIALLLKSALEPLTFYAEADHSTPTLHAKSHGQPQAEDPEQVVATRWHYAIFPSTRGAKRFREFMRIAQRLHMLRAAMRANGHPDTDKVYTVRISVDDRLGTFSLGPVDSGIDDLLSGLELEVKPQTLDTDPLANL